MQKPSQVAGTVCPLMGKDVSKVCHRCEWYTLIRGAHPQTGAEIDNWGCAIAHLPMLLINAAREARGGAVATESFRNEVVSRFVRRERGLLE